MTTCDNACEKNIDELSYHTSDEKCDALENIHRWRCQCAHANFQKKQLFVAYVIAFVALLLSLCALIIVILSGYSNQEDSGQLQLINKEDQLLLQGLRTLLKDVDLQELSVTENSDEVDPSLDVLHRVIKRATEDNKRKRRRRKKKGGVGESSGKCKCRGKRGRRGPKGDPGESGTTGPIGPAGPKGDQGSAASSIFSRNAQPCIYQRNIKKRDYIRAAHYTSEFWEDRTEFTGNNKRCVDVKEWGGIVCRNRTLQMKKSSLKFFHPAKWVQENEHIHIPAKQHRDGQFEVTEDGLYLLYSSVLFYDSKMKQGQSITKNGKILFKCMEGVDYINHSKARSFNSKYKTCSITGVAFLKAGDMLVVENLYGNSIVDLTDDSTFFGLVQLIPGMKHKHRHQLQADG